jgi:hypothetical protein
MSDQVTKEIQLEIAHILFIDRVGYSKLSMNHQRAVVEAHLKIFSCPGAFSVCPSKRRCFSRPTFGESVSAFGNPYAERERGVCNSVEYRAPVLNR